jgi:hypothetical protein
MKSIRTKIEEAIANVPNLIATGIEGCEELSGSLPEAAPMITVVGDFSARILERVAQLYREVTSDPESLIAAGQQLLTIPKAILTDLAPVDWAATKDAILSTADFFEGGHPVGTAITDYMEDVEAIGAELGGTLGENLFDEDEDEEDADEEDADEEVEEEETPIEH